MVTYLPLALKPFLTANVSFKLFAIHPHPIHTPSIAILACDSFGPDTKKVGVLNKPGKQFLEIFELLECFWSVNHLWH